MGPVTIPDLLRLCLVLVLLALIVILAWRFDRRMIRALDGQQAAELISWPAPQMEVAPPDQELLIKLHRAALMEGLLRGSERLLDSGSPNWRVINLLGMQVLDNYLQEYPEAMNRETFIDNVTIQAALNSQRRTITVQ